MESIYDYAIFGGGVVGSAIFSKLCRLGKKCILLELNDIASGESKANSAIIHAGFDAKPGTFKARFNVLGSKMYKEMCERLGVPYKQIGAYVLGDNINIVNELYSRGLKNGLLPDDMEVLNKEELNKRIGNLNDNITCGLFAKTSAITNPYLLTICLAEEGVVCGGTCKTFFKTEKIKQDNNFIIYGNNENIEAKNIINASGFGYNDISTLLNCEKYDIKFRRGEYFVLDHSEKDLINATLFPLPSEKGKGVLVTPTVDGNVLVGPTAQESENITKTTLEGLNDIKEKSSGLINNLSLKKTIRQFAGIRTCTGDDFIVEKSKMNNRVINIAGICSPGLSSAPAIAEYVVELLGLENKEAVFNRIQPYFLAKDLPQDEYDKLVKIDYRYGKVICKCEMITEGDIVFALHRPIKVKTIDGIKRRVRAGMGRCQGGFCMDKVIKIIARENGISEFEVLKEYPNSEIFISEIKVWWKFW